MSEHVSHEQYVHSVHKRIVKTARAMLAGELSFILGSRTLAALGHESGYDNDSDFNMFISIDSDTDALPIGQVREHWDKSALEKLEPEIQAAEAWAKEHGEAACASLIARFGEER